MSAQNSLKFKLESASKSIGVEVAPAEAAPTRAAFFLPRASLGRRERAGPPPQPSQTAFRVARRDDSVVRPRARRPPAKDQFMLSLSLQLSVEQIIALAAAVAALPVTLNLRARLRWKGRPPDRHQER